MEILPYSQIEKKNHVKVSSNLDEPLLTSDSIIFSAMRNLIRNSFGAGWNSLVEANASPFSGTVENLVYLPQGAIPSGEYVRLSVHDNGPGFSPERPLASYLELGVSTKGEKHGFGLYFVKLAAKALRMPIAIDSSPGDTTVSLYHPVNLK